jgi:hypothetical protein
LNLFKDQVKISDRVTGTGRKQTPIKTDNRLFLCPECRMVWEFQRKWDNGKKILRYDHIPRYGKKKKICRDCE